MAAAPSESEEPAPAQTASARGGGEVTPFRGISPFLSRWRAPLGLTLWDWLFIFFAWLTLFWFLIVSLAGWTDQDPGFDFMPVTAGIPILFLGWQAVHIGDAVANAIRGLDDDAGLILREGASVEELREEIETGGARVAYLGAACIAVVMSLGFVGGILSGNLPWQSASDLVMTIALGAVLIGVGAVMGYLLGRLVGYGRIFSVMEKRGVRFTPVPSREFRLALSALEAIFRYSFWATVVMCHWFAAWFIAWLLGFERYREAYQILFAVLLAISLGFYVFAAWRPARAFRNRLAAVYGGAEVQAGFESQRALATADLAKLDRDDPGAEELQAFIIDKRSDPMSSLLTSRLLLNGMLLWLVAMLGLAVVVAGLNLGKGTAAPNEPPQGAVQQQFNSGKPDGTNQGQAGQTAR